MFEKPNLSSFTFTLTFTCTPLFDPFPNAPPPPPNVQAPGGPAATLPAIPVLAGCSPRWLGHEKTCATAVRLLSTLCALDAEGSRAALLQHLDLVHAALTRYPGSTKVRPCRLYMYMNFDEASQTLPRIQKVY